MKIYTLMLIVLLMGCKSSGASQPEPKAQVKEAKLSIVHLGGTLRQRQDDPTKWCWIVNDAHEPVGFDGTLCAKAEGNKLTLPYGFTFSKVVTLQVSPDESLLNLGMQAGSSVGLDKATIYFTCYGSPCQMDVYTGYQSGNLWVSGIMLN